LALHVARSASDPQIARSSQANNLAIPDDHEEDAEREDDIERDERDA
jgi:hypothetical protein